jgi:hypothetical protein
LTQQIYNWVASTRPFLLLVACVGAFALAGCGGGGSGSVPVLSDYHHRSPAPDSPTTSPSSPPKTTTGTSYTLDGCEVYGPNDWFTTNLVTGGSSYVPNTVDPNSTNIINNYIAAFGGSPTIGVWYADTGGTPVNQSNNSTPAYVVQGCEYGCYDDPYGDNPTKAMPWLNTFSVQEELPHCDDSQGDCHAISLNTQSCIDYESWSSTLQTNYPPGFSYWGFNGSGFAEYVFQTSNLNYSFNSEFVVPNQARDFPSSGQVPMIGTYDFGEDYNTYIANGLVIPHVAFFTIAGFDSSPQASGGWVIPGRQSNPCSTDCTYTLPEGARLKLKTDAPCLSMTSKQDYLVCMQLYEYGAIVADHNGETSGDMFMTFGPTANGSVPWNETEMRTEFREYLRVSDFEVMTLGTIHR